MTSKIPQLAWLITLIFILTGAAPANAALLDRLNFKVWLGDREIGEHSFTITRDGALTNVLSQAKYNVKIMFVSVFKYQHEAKETWVDQCLQKIESFTVSNGEETKVEGFRDDQQFIVQQNDKTLREASSCVGTYSYWDLERLQRSALMNSQTGEIIPARVTLVGEQPLPRLQQAALTYQIETEEATIQLWYADDGRWLALSTETNGRPLIYLNEILL